MRRCGRRARSQLCDGLDVHLDDARIGRDAEAARAADRAAARSPSSTTFRPSRGRARLHRGDELEIVVERLERRHEHVEHAVAWLRAHRTARDPAGRLAGQRPTRRIVERAHRASASCDAGSRCDRGACPLPLRRLGDAFVQLREDLRARRERRPRIAGIGLVDVRQVGFRHPRLRIERQPVARSASRRAAGSSARRGRTTGRCASASSAASRPIGSTWPTTCSRPCSKTRRRRSRSSSSSSFDCRTDRR